MTIQIAFKRNDWIFHTGECVCVWQVLSCVQRNFLPRLSLQMTNDACLLQFVFFLDPLWSVVQLHQQARNWFFRSRGQPSGSRRVASQQCFDRGVVFTHSVVYSRPPSTVNDLSATKFLNSRKSCRRKLFQILYNKSSRSVSTLFHLHRVFRKDKKSTMNLANSTMKKNFVPIVDFCQSSWAFVRSFCFWFNRCKIVLEPCLFEWSHHLLL